VQTYNLREWSDLHEYFLKLLQIHELIVLLHDGAEGALHIADVGNFEVDSFEHDLASLRDAAQLADVAISFEDGNSKFKHTALSAYNLEKRTLVDCQEYVSVKTRSFNSMNALLSSFLDAWTSLRSNFLQTFLSMLGIIIGVGALVAMLSLIDGLEQLARDQIAGKTALENMSISVNTSRKIDGIRVDRDTVAVFSQTLLEELSAELPYEASAQLSVGGSAIGYARDTQELGITYRAVTFPVVDKAFELVGGRWPDSNATKASPSTVVEALVNHELALKLVAPDTNAVAALGSTFQLLGGTLKVVGVAEKSDKIGVNGTLFGYNQLAAFPEAEPGAGQIQLAFASVEDLSLIHISEPTRPY